MAAAVTQTKMATIEMDPQDLAKAIEDLRGSALFGDARSVESAVPPQAEQYYLLAIGALEQAQRFATLAHYLQMRGE